MNILMISGDRALATGRHGAFYNTLQELHKHFDRIDVICPRVERESDCISMFGNVFVHPSPWPLALQWLWVWRKGRALVRSHRHNVMTVHEYPPFYNGIGARLLHWATGVPYLLEVMHVPGVPRASDAREQFYRWLMRCLISWDARRAAAVRVINQHEVPDFLVASGVPEKKVKYMPAFYIDLDTYKPREVPKEYDVVFVGRMARNKGIDLFLDVIARARLRSLVVGDGPLMASAMARVKRERIDATFHGYARDSAQVAELLNRSRLLLMTSFNEGGPRVVLEALACGVPVVATPVGIVPDVLPPEAIEEWDATALAEKVKNILADPVLYERLRQAGLRAVVSFERSAAVARYAEAIKLLAKP